MRACISRILFFRLSKVHLFSFLELLHSQPVHFVPALCCNYAQLLQLLVFSLSTTGLTTLVLFIFHHCLYSIFYNTSKYSEIFKAFTPPLERARLVILCQSFLIQTYNKPPLNSKKSFKSPIKCLTHVGADLLPALKGESSPHLFGVTSVICGAVGAVRDPPERFSKRYKKLLLQLLLWR